jgi:hypothetical protein
VLEDYIDYYNSSRTHMSLNKDSSNGIEVTSRLKSFKCKMLVFDPVVPTDEIEKYGFVPPTLDDLLKSAGELSHRVFPA